MLTLHDDPISGNGYKIRLILAFLGRPYAYVRYDILQRETRTPAFLEINPNGKIPVLILDDGTALAESNAILYYLAHGTDWLPADRQTAAQVMSWLFYEQYSHEPNIATLRFWTHLPSLSPAQVAQQPGKFEAGKAALSLMDRHLGSRDWLVGNRPSIADIALFAYTHVADEGGFRLADYPAVGAWISRFQSLPGFLPITQLPPS